jgi:Ca-activated chloride channel family protein
MRFLHPELAWWILAALAGLGVLRWRVKRRFVASTTVRWLSAPRYRASWLRRLPLAVLAIGVLLLGGALMEPVLPYSLAEIRSRGLDIVIALDLSSSMLEEMGRIRPPRTFQNLTFSARDSAAPMKSVKTRLTATKDAIKSFVASRRDDRIALVVFSDNAYVISPLTFDHDYVVRYVDLIDDQLLRGEGMTAIGDGLALSNSLLAFARDQQERGLRRDLAEARQNAARGGGKQSGGGDRRNQVVILFTDGENNKGRDPVEVLRESNAANIRVHMVGVDLEEEVRNKPQVQRLFQSVGRFGGRYFNASTARDLELASRTLDQVEKGVLVSRPFVRDAPVYEWFAVPALVCLALAMALRAVPCYIDYT